MSFKLTVTLPDGSTLSHSDTNRSSGSVYDPRTFHRSLQIAVADALGIPGERDLISFGIGETFKYEKGQPEGVFLKRATVRLSRAIIRDDGVCDYAQPEFTVPVEVIDDFRRAV